jgi:hypothetical protein
VTHTWRWVEVEAGTTTPVPNPNGVLESGESAMVFLDISYSPAAGSPHTSTFGTGTLRGFGSQFFDLYGPAGTGGTWSFLERRPGFAIGPAGTPGSLGIFDIVVGQYPLPGQMPDPLNPIDGAFRAVWTPGSYEPRLVEFVQQSSNPSAVWVEYLDPVTQQPTLEVIAVPRTFGSVQIPVVPSPGIGVVAGLAAAFLGSRRRRPLGRR